MSGIHSQATETERPWKWSSDDIGDGVVAGIIGGIAMGVVLQFGTDILPLVGSLTGQPSLVIGWIIHLVMSAVFGAAFVVLVSLPIFHDVSRSFSGTVLLGIVHATMLATLVIAILPFTMTIFGTSQMGGPLPFQQVPGPGGGGLIPAAIFGVSHLLYGAILGGAYAVLRDRTADD